MIHMSDYLFELATQPNPEICPYEPLDINSAWLEADQGKNVCPECLTIKHDHYPLPMDVAVADEPDGRVSVPLQKTNITIWRRDFLELIWEFMPDFVLGRCLLPDGSEDSLYCTCYSNKIITVQGNQFSRYEQCPACGIKVTKVISGFKWISKSQLKGDLMVYQDEKGSLYVTEGVIRSIDFGPYYDNAVNNRAIVIAPCMVTVLGE